MFGISYDLTWLVLVLVFLGLTFAALLVWFRTRWDRPWEAGLTLLAIVVVPVLGPAAFLASRGRRPLGDRPDPPR
jgi:glucan phosphoethanolaminetransferase (alkaline phosphatase superfamily)